VNSVAVLYGRDLINAIQYDTLSTVTLWLQRTARAWGGRDASCAGLWMAITGALVATGYAPLPVADGGFPLADRARRRLARALRQLDGSRDLVLTLAEGRTPDLVLHAIEGTLTGADEADLARLRAGLDRIGGRR
jgi:hypothetical protein